MRFLLTTIGTAGDVHPFIAVGRALRARGHEVVLLTNPHFAQRIADAGLGFWPLGTEEEYLAFVRHGDLVAGARSPTFVINELILPSFRPTVEAIRTAQRVLQPDAVFAHHIALGAGAACESLEIPFAQAVLAPLFWVSRCEQVVFPTLPLVNPPRIVDAALRWSLRPFGRWMIDRPVNRLRREVGLAPLRNIGLTGARGGDGLIARERMPAERAVRTLGLWSKHFRPAQTDDPSNGVICGFATWDRPASHGRPEEVEREKATRRWMDDGEPPVVVTLGSSVSHHGEEIYALAARACAALGHRGMLLMGAAPARGMPEGVRAIAYAPYSMVMPRGCVTVHHAGIGTTAAAMRAGRPQVIIPFANDEFDNAARAGKLGVARTVRRSELSLKTLCAAIDGAISDRDGCVAAEKLGEVMRGEEDGAVVAAGELERVAGRSSP